MITAVGGCASSVDSIIPAATPSNIFDWIDAAPRPAANNQAPAKPGAKTNNAQPEIYYGSDVASQTPDLTNIASADMPERFGPARLASVGPLTSINDGSQ